MQAYSLWKGLDTDMDLGKLKTLFNRYLVNLAVLILAWGGMLRRSFNCDTLTHMWFAGLGSLSAWAVHNNTYRGNGIGGNVIAGFFRLYCADML